MVHEQVKPLQCNVCDFRTATNWQLIVHKKTHSKHQQKLACDECGQQFDYLIDVVHHKTNTHGDHGGGTPKQVIISKKSVIVELKRSPIWYCIVLYCF